MDMEIAVVEEMGLLPLKQKQKEAILSSGRKGHHLGTSNTMHYK